MQQSKIVAAINALDADVVALMEIENSVKLGEAPDEALGNLVDAPQRGSRRRARGPTCRPRPRCSTRRRPTSSPTRSSTSRPSATPVGDSFADVDETVWDIAREPIAQTFDVDGKVLTVVANHFKSKSPPTGSAAPSRPTCRASSTPSASSRRPALVDFVDGITADPAKSADVMLLGDFNAYHEEDPIQVLHAAGFVDLVPDNTDEYTYTFDGELGSLDHALATAVAGGQRHRHRTSGRINSAEWSDRGYEFGAAEAGTPFRSSDHDPVKVGV